MRRRAQAVLDDATPSDWHRKRAMGDLKRTEKAAQARAAQRDARVLLPAKRHAPVTAQEHEALLKFWSALLGEQEARRLMAEIPIKHGGKSAAPAASGVPRATMPQPERFCERCRVSFEICHCEKPKPTRAELAAVAALDARDKVESADDLTPCPLCLIPRGRCHHSGRRNPAADISFLQAQLTGQ